MHRNGVKGLRQEYRSIAEPLVHRSFDVTPVKLVPGAFNQRAVIQVFRHLLDPRFRGMTFF